MSDCTDMTTTLARELTQGIKNEVEDLSAVFKKMAILKPMEEESSIARNDSSITDVSDTADIIGQDESDMTGNTEFTDTAGKEESARDTFVIDGADIIRNTDSDSHMDDVRRVSSAADTVRDSTVRHVRSSGIIPAIDDTKEMTVYSAKAPVTVYSRLSFVNSARPVKAVNAVFMDICGNEIYPYGSHREPAA